VPNKVEDYSDIGTLVTEDYSDIGTPIESEFRNSPPATFIDKIKSFFNDPEKELAKSQNIYALSEITGLPIRDVADNYELMRRTATITGITPEAERLEHLAVALIPGIAMQAATSPIGTAAGLIAFGALDKFIDTDKWVSNYEQFTGASVPSPIKKTIDLIDFVGKGLIVGGVFKTAPKLADTFLRNKVYEYKLPETIKLSKEQVRDIFQTGKLTTIEEQSLFGSLGLKGKELRTAIEKGVSIDVPTEQITTLVDKPIWAKIKKIVGVEPIKEVTTQMAGKPKKGMAGLLKSPTETTPKPEDLSILKPEEKAPVSVAPQPQGEGVGYRSTHQIDTKTASPITDISEEIINSFIDDFKKSYGYPALKSKEVNKLKAIMSNPDSDVTVYRASPKNELNSGDWVTIDKDYANDIKNQNGGKVYKYTIKAKELFYPKTLEGFKDLPSLNKWGAFQYQSSKLSQPQGEGKVTLYHGATGETITTNPVGRYYAEDKAIAKNFGKITHKVTIDKSKLLDITDAKTVGDMLDKTGGFIDINPFSPIQRETTIKELGSQYKALEMMINNKQRQALIDKGYEGIRFIDKTGQTKHPTVVLFREKLSQPQEIKEVTPPAEPPKEPPVAISGEPKPSQDPVKKIIEALKGAKDVRKQQETLYKKARGQKLAKMMAVSKKTSGEKGFFSEKASLKGELPKVEFESIRKNLTQEDIDTVFNMVKDTSHLDEWDKLTAREGLANLLGETGGKVPTEGQLKKLHKVFGKDFTDALLAKRSTFEKFKEAGYQLANVPRAIMSSLDFSFGLRQGVFAAPKFRKEFFNSWTKQFSWFGSERAYQESQKLISQNPNYKLAVESGVQFTEMDSLMSEREEKFASQWADVIPGIRNSSRAYTGFANKFRMDIFDSLVKDAEKLGLNPQENADLTKSIGEFVNAATGRGTLGNFENAALALNAFFFSPRLMASRLNIITQLTNPNFYYKASPFIRKNFISTLLTFLGTGATILGLSKLMGADVGTDVRSSDFGKIKVGATRVDIWGGFQQYVRMIGQLVSGQYVSSTTGKVMTLGEGYRALNRLDILLRQIESKEAPIPSFITEILKQKTYTGEEINIPKEIALRFVPMLIQDLYDVIKDNPQALPLIPLAPFGVGIQTYKPNQKKKF